MLSTMFQATLLLFLGAVLPSVLSGGRYEAPFGCPANLILSDKNRTGALTLINGIRSRVALGDFQALTFLPSASDMEKMAWDCNLEELAQNVVMGCPQRPPLPPPPGKGLNSQFFGQGSSAFDRMFPIQSAMLQWSEISHLMWPADNMLNSFALQDFANMIHATTASVGCSGAMCGPVSSAACFFSSPNVRFGELVYTSGQPCQDDTQCTQFAPAFCENGLCVNAVRPPTTTGPTTTTTSTTTTTTTTTTTRRRSTDCPSRAFSSSFREVALGMHNNFRSLVARGLARNGEYANENAPPSSRMDLMEYDCQAEQLALNHVRSCDQQPSPAPSRPGYSENIHVLLTHQTDLLGALQNAVATFTSELTNNGIPSNMILTPEVFQRTQRTVTRVSKVLWGSNRFVGCATVLCGRFFFTSCMYRDPVNVVGASIYKIGAVCGACPTGPNNCNTAVGLCSY